MDGGFFLELSEFFNHTTVLKNKLLKTWVCFDVRMSGFLDSDPGSVKSDPGTQGSSTFLPIQFKIKLSPKFSTLFRTLVGVAPQTQCKKISVRKFIID
jgi:hypothetical protein